MRSRHPKAEALPSLMARFGRKSNLAAILSARIGSERHALCAEVFRTLAEAVRVEAAEGVRVEAVCVQRSAPRRRGPARSETRSWNEDHLDANLRGTARIRGQRVDE